MIWFKKYGWATATPVDEDGRAVGSPTKIKMRRTSKDEWESDSEISHVVCTAPPSSIKLEFMDDVRFLPLITGDPNA